LTATNFCGSSTVYDTITVLPNTVEAFFNANPLVGCQPLSVQFTQSMLGINQWWWDFDDGNQSILLDPLHEFLYADTFDVVLHVSNGCATDSMMQQVIVLPPPMFDFVATPDSVCVGDLVSFQPVGTNIAGYSWNFDDGNFSQFITPTHSYSDTGTFNVSLAVLSTINGCFDTVYHPVVVLPTPIASFSLTPTSGCVPLYVDFQENGSFGDFFVWDFGDGNSSGGTSTFHIYDSVGTFTVHLTSINASGCSDTTNALILVHPVPVADFSYTIEQVPEAILPVHFTNNSIGAVSYDWHFGDGASSNYIDPGHIYDVGPLCSYSPTLIVSNEFSCRDTTTQIIQIPRDMRIYAPNAFSPTGDGLNEEFVILGADHDLSTVHLMIFNRWGDMIHEMKGATPSWDGRGVNGNMSKNDVYVWKLKARIQCGYDEEEFIGHVTLIR